MTDLTLDDDFQDASDEKIPYYTPQETSDIARAMMKQSPKEISNEFQIIKQELELEELEELELLQP